jgi:hypothetical protein
VVAAAEQIAARGQMRAVRVQQGPERGGGRGAQQLGQTHAALQALLAVHHEDHAVEVARFLTQAAQGLGGIDLRRQQRRLRVHPGADGRLRVAQQQAQGPAQAQGQGLQQRIAALRRPLPQGGGGERGRHLAQQGDGGVRRQFQQAARGMERHHPRQHRAAEARRDVLQEGGDAVGTLCLEHRGGGVRMPVEQGQAELDAALIHRPAPGSAGCRAVH